MAKKTRRKTRSPLKRKPLRNPGESLQDQIESLIEDRLVFPAVAAACFVMLAVYEWVRWATKSSFHPIVVSVLALGAIGYMVIALLVLRPKVRAMRLGLDGEKAVAQHLELHRDPDWYVLNDIPCDGFNIDHVILTSRGLFTVETKTFSKPTSGEAKVVFDGKRLLVGGHSPSRDPVIQARANRDWLRDFLRRETGKAYAVRPVVVFPGWYVDSVNTSDVWVLNEKALPAFIRSKDAVLPQDDVHLALARLGDYIERWANSA